MGLEIARLAVGGGTLALCPMPGGTGRYAEDLADLAHLAPGLVLSMTPLAELAAHGAASLPDDLGQRGIGWLHLPVADFDTPDMAANALWPALSGAVHGQLASGGRVVVHCKGGCGRSGMAVLRLMVEAGEDAGAALARLRAARPCAVETDAQMAWALSGKAG